MEVSHKHRFQIRFECNRFIQSRSQPQSNTKVCSVQLDNQLEMYSVLPLARSQQSWMIWSWASMAGAGAREWEGCRCPMIEKVTKVSKGVGLSSSWDELSEVANLGLLYTLSADQAVSTWHSSVAPSGVPCLAPLPDNRKDMAQVLPPSVRWRHLPLWLHGPYMYTYYSCPYITPTRL